MNSGDIEIELPSGERLPAYFAGSAEPMSAPGIVVLQEIFGVNANIRAIVDDYAARGFNAVAPDLFWRQEAGLQLDPANADETRRAMELMKGMDQPLAVDDALFCAAYLRDVEWANGKVGAVGYCIGGKIAYLLSTRPAIDASVSYYGIAIYDALDKAPEVRGPLLLHIAEGDHLCPPEAQTAIKSALGSLPGVIILTHPRVDHAFARRGGTAFDAAATDRADAATSALFADALGSSV
ncbi:dienelactone hydrolase family protein [Sphingomonas sp. UYP23]